MVVEQPVSWSNSVVEVLPCSSVHSLVPSSHHFEELPSDRVSTLQPVASSYVEFEVLPYSSVHELVPSSHHVSMRPSP